MRPAVVAVDLESSAVTCHPLVGLPRVLPLAAISLAFDAGGITVRADDRGGTFTTPLPPSLSLSSFVD